MTDPTSRFPYLLSEPDEAEGKEIEEQKAEERADWERENPREY